jgi:hypothetical protein
LTAAKCLAEVQKTLHFMTLSNEAPAASRQRFICSRTSSVWRSIGARTISPVSGSNGGNPETKIMLPARVTGDPGGDPHRSTHVEIGSTRSASRFIGSPSIGGQ